MSHVITLAASYTSNVGFIPTSNWEAQDLFSIFAALFATLSQS